MIRIGLNRVWGALNYSYSDKDLRPRDAPEVIGFRVPGARQKDCGQCMSQRISGTRAERAEGIWELQ